MMPPGGGFSPAGTSGGHGVGSFVPKRTRTAVAGLNRYARARARAARASAACRSGVTSSRIQKPRPCVPATRSEHRHVLSSFTWMSRTEIAGMSSRSDCQWSPSSNETHTCVSVARVEQALLARILADRVGDGARRDAGVDLRPRLAAVVRAPEVRVDVVEAQRVRGGVRRAACRSGPPRC